MFKKLTIQNFRGIKKLKIEPLNKINVFVGDNMVGKTTILDAMFVAVNPDDLILPFRTNKFRSIDYIPDLSQVLAFFHYFNTNSEILIKLTKSDSSERIVKISPKFKSSNLYDFVNLEEKNNLLVSENKSEIASTAENIKNIAGLESNYKIANNKYKSIIELLPNGVAKITGDEKFRQDLKGRYINTTTCNNINLCEVFSKAITGRKKDNILTFLKKFKSSIKDINLIHLMQDNILVVDDDEFKEAIDINYYGSGLTRALYIFLSSLAQDDIVLIDEIENGLFFSRQKIIWKTINEIIKSMNLQFFITTHSADMIRNLYDTALEENFLDSISLFRIEKLNEKNQCIYYSKENFDIAMNLDLETRG